MTATKSQSCSLYFLTGILGKKNAQSYKLLVIEKGLLFFSVGGLEMGHNIAMFQL